MIESEKNEKNATVEKIKSLFNKIKNFEQLKYEVYEIRKTFEKTNEEVNKIKDKYSNINDKMKDVTLFLNSNTSFEHIQGDLEFKELTKRKMEEFDNKFKVVLGDYNMDVEENGLNAQNDEKDNSNNDNSTDREKSKSIKKEKILNLVDINKKLIQYQRAKVNVNDFELKNVENQKRVNEVKEKLNDVIKNLYGTNDIENIDGFFRDKNSLFASKSEFDKYKAQTDEELKKIYEKLENLNKLYEELFAKMKDKCSINDLDSMKDLILEKTEELFINMKNKNIDNSAIKILQKNFKQLVELLAEKEEQENNMLFSKKGLNSGGHTCASCEKYLGILKDDSSKHIPWKKLPLKIKDNENKFRLYKFGNGYSRFLRMLNFDSTGTASLKPFDDMNEYFNNTSTNNNEMAKSHNNKSLDTLNNISKENEKTTNTNLLKSRNKLDKIENELPNIKISTHDYNDKTARKMNNSTSSFNFISPKITRNNKKKYYKYDL